MKNWPDFQIDVTVNEDSASDHRYEVHALTRVSDGTHFDVVRRGGVLRNETSEAIELLDFDVRSYLDRTKLPTTPGAVIRSTTSGVPYVLGLDGKWHSGPSFYSVKDVTDNVRNFRILAS